MPTRTHRSARVRALLCILALPFLLAGCGSSAHNSADTGARTTVTRTVTQTASSAATTASTTTSTSTPTTTSTPPQPAADQCVAADLALSFLGGNGATGHLELSFTLRNTSSASCRTGGYPGVQFLDASGHALPTHPDHTTDDFFGHTTLRELTVAPGATVSFRLGTTDIGSGGSNAGCVSAKALQVIAPNDTATMRVGLHTGVFECRGKVTVSPIQAGANPAAG
jgi:hypothetical protein